jgi:hypothetical protein
MDLFVRAKEPAGAVGEGRAVPESVRVLVVAVDPAGHVHAMLPRLLAHEAHGGAAPAVSRTAAHSAVLPLPWVQTARTSRSGTGAQGSREICSIHAEPEADDRKVTRTSAGSGQLPGTANRWSPRSLPPRYADGSGVGSPG